MSTWVGRVRVSLAYHATVPVSRKRKKNRKKNRATGLRAYTLPGGPAGRPTDLAATLSGIAEQRRQLDERRASLATAAAGPMIAELVELAVSRSDLDLESELCSRIGRTLAQQEDAPIEDHVGPNTLAEAGIDAAAAAVRATIAPGANGWEPAWRVLTAVAGIVNHPLRDQATDAIDDLRSGPGGHRLPETPAGPVVTGPVRWTRDGYGSRFGVAAPLRTADGRDYWYLWDIDACGHDAFTVHSRCHTGPDEALTDWQAGVGLPAAEGTVFEPVDDVWLLAELMPYEQGMMRPGGENAEQFAEYHRSRRLAEAVLDATGPTAQPRTPTSSGLDHTTAGPVFTAWLQQHRPDGRRPADLDEVVTELADSWQIGDRAALYHTCSPHRVALTAEHIRDFYEDDFAADLIALLPDWTAWLAERNATPAHLAERCAPFARGEQHSGIRDDKGPNYLIRITE